MELFKMAVIALPPPAANNAGFLALYNQVPLATTNQIERDIWELTQIDVHEFGRNYIQNLSQATYNALPIVLQDTIAAEVHTVGVGALALPAVMRVFVNAMLP